MNGTILASNDETLALNKSHSPETAQGIGLQVLLHNFGDRTILFNKAILLGKLSAEGFLNLPFRARYIQTTNQTR